MTDIMDLLSSASFKSDPQSPLPQEHHQQLGGFYLGDPATPIPPTRDSSFPPESSAMAEARARSYQNNNDFQPNDTQYHNGENQPEELPRSQMQTVNETLETDDCTVKLVPVPGEPTRIANGGPEGDKIGSNGTGPVVVEIEAEPMIIEPVPVNVGGIDPVQEKLRLEGGKGG